MAQTFAVAVTVAALFLVTCAARNIEDLSSGKLDPFSLVNCDFDDSKNGLCHYTNSKRDNFDWTRDSGLTSSGPATGPDGDHTTGKGYFLYTEASYKNPSDKARLDGVTATAPANGGCISFWYHMYGANIGSLTVYTSETEGVLGPVQWSQSGYTKLREWKEGKVSIAPGSEFQLIIVGEIGDGYLSDIAIDDISLADGECQGVSTGKPDPYFLVDCDFDDVISFCHYTNSKKDDFDWTRDSGLTSSGPETGPDGDHTTGSGYYLYTEASQKSPSDTARLDSALATAPANGGCISFWYHMYGANIGSLTVYTSETEGVLGPVQWSRSGYTKVREWKEGKVSVAPDSEFQLIIIGEIGDGFLSDIAIDDISLADGECQGVSTGKPDPYFLVDCDFDDVISFCHYTNSKMDDFDWTRDSGLTSSGPFTGPDGDHTTGSGYYLYTEASQKSPSDTARLDSALATAPANGGCISFWYHMYGANIGSLTVYTSETDGVLGPVQWSRSGYTKVREWKEGKVSVAPDSEFQLIIIGEIGDGFLSDIAIDDISLADGECKGLSTEKPDPFFLVDCDFDDLISFCHYTNSKMDDFDWTRDSGLTSSGPFTGPDGDHTTGSGYYLYTEASQKSPSEKARLDGVTATSPAYGACISFWYHMYGANIGSLTVYTSETDGVLGPVQWSRSGYTKVKEWKEGRVNIDPDTEFQLIFIGEVGNGYLGDIAIDDISLSVGRCCATPIETPDPFFLVDCNFDDVIGFCHYTNSEKDDFDWTRYSGSTPSGPPTGPDGDHTTGHGYYLYTEASYKNPSDKARLDGAPATSPAYGACISFWYHMYGADIGSLTVYTSETDGVLGPVQWSRSGYTKVKEWKEGKVSVAPDSEFQLIIIGEVGHGYQSDIAIDDISLAYGECQNLPTEKPDPYFLVDCDFDDVISFCHYTNSKKDGFDWTRYSGSTPSGPTTGPDGDHTTGSGYYLYTEASYLNPSEKARLDGVTVTAPANGGCITFWYHMYGTDIGSLTIYMSETDGFLGPVQWSQSGDTQQNQWFVANMSIDPGTDFQLIFIGEVGSGYQGDIAIDDISLADGKC